ncbi:RHS repeat domain-containing protein [Niastella sp. OAS944]|uniref:RHS repeat domain-containing protein n=1 Tax=Niastella sp. OAS944 TaxID=2664089 RepID=UPI0034968C4D|nr:YD repeat-containing protein [Chitinophagaceae bacterium OAS944]
MAKKIQWRLLTTALAGMLFFSNSNAQNIGISNQVTISSPTAAALAKYGDIPVSYHTGTPAINIPLYNIKSGSLQMPVSLSYHASGLKVQEQASWVGAGWVLNAGGVITRSVMGAPDDKGILAAYTKYGYYSEYGYYSYLYSFGGGACNNLECPDPAMTHPADDAGIAKGIKDGEPDLYFYNFNGYTGKFYFSDDRTPVLVPESDLKIEVNFPVGSTPDFYGIHGFTITTSDGTKYIFGDNTSGDGNINAIETTTFTSAKSFWTGQGSTSSWFLNKVVSADGLSSITLTYQKEQYSYYTLSTFPKSNAQTQTAGAFDWAYDYDIVKNFIDGVRLNKIIFQNGEMDLNPGTTRTDLSGYQDKSWYDSPDDAAHAYLTAKTLGSISIQSPDLCKTFNFNYSYFFDGAGLSNLLCYNSFTSICNNIQSDKYRLKLESVQETACDESVSVPPYTFNYYGETVARKLSFGIDHWGFYNGADNNRTLIPTYTLKTGNELLTVDGAERDSHWPAMRGGALQKITYPTGGTTQFDYEPHKVAVNYVKYDKVPRGGPNGGYDGHNGWLGDGGSNPFAVMMTFTGNPYEMSIYNSSEGGSARLDIYNGSYLLESLFVDVGQQKTKTIQITPGTYQVVITKLNASGGNGASSSFYEWVPTPVNTQAIVGGLRIKTVTSNDAMNSPDVVTNYTYGPSSTGILYSKPVYLQLLRNDLFKIVGNSFFTSGPGNVCSRNGCLFCDGVKTLPYFISPTSIRPMETTQGNHIGYYEVKAAQPGNGFSVFRYYGSNVWDNQISDVCTRFLNTGECTSTIPSYPQGPLPFEPMRGELKYEGHYNENGQIVADKSCFPQFQQDAIETPGTIVKNVAYLAFPDRGFGYSITDDPGGGDGEFSLFPSSDPFAVSYVSAVWGTDYVLKSYRRVMDSVISTKYNLNDGNSISTTNVSYYNSNYHNQLSRAVTYISGGGIVSTIYKYASDFRLQGCEALSTGIQTWNDASYNNLVAFYNTVNTCTSANNVNCRYAAYQLYRWRQYQARSSYIQTRRSNFTDASNNFNTCHQSAENSADGNLKPILALQDIHQNPLIEQAEYRNGKLLHAAFTKYDFVSNPGGKLYPVKTQQISLASPSTTFSAATVSGSGLAKDSRYLDESNYIFSGGNLNQVVSRNGVTQTYLWDVLHTTPIAKATNAQLSEVAYTSFENGQNEGNWTISDGSRNTSNKITGQKSYDLIGGKTIVASPAVGKQYIVSYWATGAINVSANGTAVPASNTGLTKNSWTYYEHVLPNTTSSVSITGTGASIDELRLYPNDAEIETYCYLPLTGIITSCDRDSRIARYEYDGLGRLIVIRDQDGNIIKTVKYHFKQ